MRRDKSNKQEAWKDEYVCICLRFFLTIPGKCLLRFTSRDQESKAAETSCWMYVWERINSLLVGFNAGSDAGSNAGSNGGFKGSVMASERRHTRVEQVSPPASPEQVRVTAGGQTPEVKDWTLSLIKHYHSKSYRNMFPTSQCRIVSFHIWTKQKVRSIQKQKNIKWFNSNARIQNKSYCNVKNRDFMNKTKTKHIITSCS